MRSILVNILMQTKMFVPIARIDRRTIPVGQLELQVKPKGNEIVVYMAVTPLVATTQKPLP